MKFIKRGVCKKCKLLKEGICKDGHNPVQRGSSIYVCGYQQKPYKEKAKAKSNNKKSLKKKLWTLVSLAVRTRDKKCMLCNESFDVKKLHAHHYIHTDASSPKYRYDLRNLVSLCYHCHLRKIHGGSMRHILDLENNLISSGFISKDELERIAEDKQIIPRLEIEDYELLIKKFKDESV